MKILLTAITPGIGGAGDYLIHIKNNFDGVVISPLKVFKKNNFCQKFISQSGAIVIKFLGLIFPIFYKGHLTIYHHQTLGYFITRHLLSSMNKIDFYVLDASFFCKKSYNFLNNKACFNCLKTFNPDITCKSFPRVAKTSRILSFRNQLLKSKDKIVFIVQTASHRSLIQDSFLKSSRVVIRKMKHPKLDFQFPSLSKYTEYDFVFHGNNLDAKGANYVLNLSMKMKKQTFFFPFKVNELLKNCFYKQTNWDGDLIDALMNCKIVLCPSLWSAPIESSIIKTMLLNKPVAIVKSDYSASVSEYPSNAFIQLNGNIELDRKILENYLDSPKELKKISNNAYLWAKKYLEEE